MSKLTELGFTGPFETNADNSVNGIYNGYPYNIHASATSEIWDALQADIASKTIVVAPYVAPTPIMPTASQIAMQQIKELERTITSRRIREATLTDAGKVWLADIDAQIAALRLTF